MPGQENVDFQPELVEETSGNGHSASFTSIAASFYKGRFLNFDNQGWVQTWSTGCQPQQGRERRIRKGKRRPATFVGMTRL